MLAGAGIATGITAALAVWFWSRLRRVELSVATLVTPIHALGPAAGAPIELTFTRPSRDLEAQMVAPSQEDMISPHFVRSF
jgi:hypothetical protein